MDDIVSIPKESVSTIGSGVSVYSGFNSIVTGPSNAYLLIFYFLFLILTIEFRIEGQTTLFECPSPRISEGLLS